MARALLIPAAHSSTLNPGGTLILLTGICSAGSGAGGWGTGDSGEFASSAGCPFFHVGGGAGCWAQAATTNPLPKAKTATNPNPVHPPPPPPAHLLRPPPL